MNATKTTTRINGREMQVEPVATGAHAAADLAANGYEPTYYAVTGKRGACYLAVRSATTGEMTITGKV